MTTSFGRLVRFCEFRVLYVYEIEMMTASFAKTRGQDRCFADFTDSSHSLLQLGLGYGVDTKDLWKKRVFAFLSRKTR
jgi:hypothetical protein